MKSGKASVVALVLVGVLLAGCAPVDSVTSPTPSASVLPSTTPAQTAFPVASQTPEGPRLFDVSDVFAFGNWEYRVFLVVRRNIIGTVRPRGEFALVYFSLTNVGNRNFGIGPQDFELLSSNGNHYAPDTTRTLSLYSASKLDLVSSLENYPPGVAFDTVLVFDINPQETDLWFLPKQAAGHRVALACRSLNCSNKG